MSYRRCKWLPDRLKEESVQASHCVEKALLKAVRNLYFKSVMIRIPWILISLWDCKLGLICRSRRALVGGSMLFQALFK